MKEYRSAILLCGMRLRTGSDLVAVYIVALISNQVLRKYFTELQPIRESCHGIACRVRDASEALASPEYIHRRRALQAEYLMISSMVNWLLVVIRGTNHVTYR